MQTNAPDVRSTFASRVRQVREGQGWSQEELARRLSEVGLRLDPTAITRLERGERSVRVEEAVAVAQTLGVPLDELLQSSGRVGLEQASSLMKRYGALSVTLTKAQEELDYVREQLVETFAKYPDAAGIWRRSLEHPANKGWREVLPDILREAEAQGGSASDEVAAES